MGPVLGTLPKKKLSPWCGGPVLEDFAEKETKSLVCGPCTGDFTEKETKALGTPFPRCRDTIDIAR